MTRLKETFILECSEVVSFPVLLFDLSLFGFLRSFHVPLLLALTVDLACSRTMGRRRAFFRHLRFSIV